MFLSFRLLSLLLVCLSVFLSYVGFSRYDRYMESPNWPTADGVVTRHSIKGSSSSSSSLRGAEITYRYRIDGQAFNSRQIGFKDKWFDSVVLAKEYCEKQYPIGSSVLAYYNPERPSEAYLLHEDTEPPYALAGISTGLLFLAALMWMFAK